MNNSKSPGENPAEVALRASAQAYHMLVETARDLIWSLDAQGRWTFVNQAARRIYGYEPAEMLGRPFSDFKTSEPAENDLAALAHVKAGTLHFNYETIHRRKDGSPVNLNFNATVVLDDQGRIMGATGTAQDITERKQKERLKGTALDVTANAIFITNHEGVIQWANFAFTRFSGYTAEDVIGRKASLVKSGVHERPFYQDLWQTILGGRVWHGQITNRHKDGHLYVSEQTISPVRDLSGAITHFVNVQQDVTDRKKAEEALRQTREQFIDLFENAPVGYHELDAEGRLTRINQTELNMLGYSADELLGQYVWKLTADDVNSRKSIMTNFASKRHPEQPFERVFRRKDGSTFPVMLDLRMLKKDDDTIAGIRVIVQDITTRKQAEEKAQHLASYPELNPNPVLEFSADGTLAYHNPAALIMAQKMGVPKLNDLLPPLTRQIVVECLATNQPYLRLETHHGKHTLSWSFYPIASQKIVHCYVGDISQRLLLEEEFRQSQKMEAIGQLSGGVAHDFNNLLTVIMGNLGLIEASGQVAPEISEPVQAISHAAKRAANLTRQLLAFSRRQVMQSQNLDLNEVVDHITKMLRRVIGEEVRLKLDFAPQILQIHADPGMLEQAILNLSINARDAMPKGGRLTLRTAAINLTKEEAGQMRSARAGAFAVLTVADTGTGIVPENIEHVFEPFFTTKEVGKGTGLGLASVYGIAQQHRGWVTVESEVGCGTTFNVYLPLLTTLVVAASPPAPAKEIPRGTETILLVEDDQAVQMIVNLSLTRLGYRVMVASNGHDALKLWEAHKTEIQLVLTDMIMPEGLSGRDIAQRFKKEAPGIKIIFMSGYSADIAGHDFSKAEGDLFLGKPFEMHALAAMIRKSLDTMRAG
jgi:PAS domain S-box-containing protein